MRNGLSRLCNEVRVDLGQESDNDQIVFHFLPNKTKGSGVEANSKESAHAQHPSRALVFVVYMRAQGAMRVIHSLLLIVPVRSGLPHHTVLAGLLSAPAFQYRPSTALDLVQQRVVVLGGACCFLSSKTFIKISAFVGYVRSLRSLKVLRELGDTGIGHMAGCWRINDLTSPGVHVGIWMSIIATQ